MRELVLFAGSGGGVLGGVILGWRTVCAVEIAPYPRSVLLARQRDGILPRFPVWDDVCTFDGKPWAGHVDIITGGFPCTEISIANPEAEGITGGQSGLWEHMARIVGEVRPRYVFVENSPMLTSRGLGRVLGDLASMGYDAVWGVLGADDAGAPHIRERIWILAYASIEGLPVPECEVTQGAWGRGEGRAVAELRSAHLGAFPPGPFDPAWADGSIQRSGEWPTAEPDVCGVVDGLASRVDRLKSIGNGQVPAVVALAWRVLSARVMGERRISLPRGCT